MARQQLKISHVEYQQQILELAQACGWAHHLHVRRSIGKGRKWVTATNIIGYPDLTLFREASRTKPGRIIFVEIKVPPDKLSPEQGRVLEWLRRCDHEAYCWYPADLDEAVVVLQR